MSVVAAKTIGNANAAAVQTIGDMNVPSLVDTQNKDTASVLSCRPGCGACCIAPSITSPIPGMPEGKPAGIPCVNLLDDMRCALFGLPTRPHFCGGLQPARDMCGESRFAALNWLGRLEQLTAPSL